MLKHNKKKNSRIVYEQLMILATRLALTNHISESKHLLGMIKANFHPSKMLGKEKKLFDSILETQTASKEDAEAILTEILSESRFINEKRLEKEKVDLINQVLREIGKDLFSIPIKDYKLIASTQILFNEMRNNFRYSNPNERVKIKNLLIETMNRPIVEQEDYEMDSFTYQILVNKFNKKYTPLMNEDQKEILSSWISYLMNEDQAKFKRFLKLKVIKAKAEIDNCLIKEDHINAEYGELLKEARQELNKDLNLLEEENIHKIMRYYDLIDDLREVNDVE